MKSLGNLVDQTCTDSLSEKLLTKFLTTEVKNYELFSESELKSYFNSEKFLKDLSGCLEAFSLSEDEGLFQFFVLKGSGDDISLVLDAFSIPD